eukprot:EG_transcript_9526
MLLQLGLVVGAGLLGLGGGALVLPVSRGSSTAGRDLLARFGAQPHRLPKGGADYFYTTVEVGTPFQPFDLILDTGSSLMFVPCVSSCTDCGVHDHATGWLNSSSFRDVDCNADTCTQEAGLPMPGCSRGGCQYTIAYQEGSGSTGQLVTDRLRLGNATADVTFGCTKTESGLLKTQSADGLMGLGRGSLSLPQQLASTTDGKGAAGSFSLCLSGARPGSVAFGAVQPPAGLRWTPLLPRLQGSSHNWYRIGTVAMGVGPVQLPLTPDDFAKNGYYGTVVDSGSTDLLLPATVYGVFLTELRRQTPDFPSDVIGSAGSPCFPDKDGLWDALPTIRLTLQGGYQLTLHPINYISLEDQGYCLNVFDNHQYGLVIGSLAMMDKLVVFDLPNDRIGFAAFDCSLGLNASGGSSDEGGTQEPSSSSKMSMRTLILLSLIPVALLAVLILGYWLRASYRASAYGAMQPDSPQPANGDVSAGEETDDVELQLAPQAAGPACTAPAFTPVVTC